MSECLPDDAGDEACGDAWEDEDSFGYGHECRLPKGHSGDHICAYQDDDRDDCRWRNWDDTQEIKRERASRPI